MNQLQVLPMQKGWIYEAIISTFSKGEPHAAPIGVWTEDFDTLHMEIFDSSQTLRGILDTGRFVANFPSDVGTLHTALFHPELLSFERSQDASAPVLLGSAATVELVLRQAMPVAERVRITGTVVRASARAEIKLINRAAGLLVESLILATRLRYLDAAAVRESLAENYRVIRKVAPGSTCETTMAELLRDIDLPS
ncbi:MAG: DUF447 family protein [Actinobacteria bacterium]|nr:DUF447 family protein [Actinomycetota bacterium]